MDHIFNRLLSNVRDSMANLFIDVNDAQRNRRVYNKDHNDSGPGKGLCVGQAVLVHGVVPM